ncbi:MAG: leucine-rich repeat domain-containing protein, partial [Bacteroidales bacterium]
IKDLQDIASVKITLEKDGERIVLPSLAMTGTSDSLSTATVFVNAGAYRLVSYKAFDNAANLISNCEPDKNNTFVVEASVTTDFVMPINVKTILAPNNLRSSLYAICTEAFGSDSTLWPSTWNANTEWVKWEGLEFELDEYDNPMYLVALTLDKNFAPMKKLASSIVNIPTLENLIICDNALEELPENFGVSKIGGLMIRNTNLKALPESMRKMDLKSVFLENNALTSFPEVICVQPDMRMLDIINENITEIPASIGNLDQITWLRISGTQITALPDVFDQLFRISTLDISNNKNLAVLPATLKMVNYGNQSSYMRGVYAGRCAFTSFPDALISPKYRQIDLSGNPITSINKEDIESMTNLDCLQLNDMNLSSFPKLDKENMRMLSLINTGLTAADVDRSGMPNLYSVHNGNDGITYTYDFLFFTQEQFDAIFGSNIGPELKEKFFN